MKSVDADLINGKVREYLCRKHGFTIVHEDISDGKECPFCIEDNKRYRGIDMMIEREDMDKDKILQHWIEIHTLIIITLWYRDHIDKDNIEEYIMSYLIDSPDSFSIFLLGKYDYEFITYIRDILEENNIYEAVKQR